MRQRVSETKLRWEKDEEGSEVNRNCRCKEHPINSCKRYQVQPCAVITAPWGPHEFRLYRAEPLSRKPILLFDFLLPLIFYLKISLTSTPVSSLYKQSWC